jgi:hypothetical protein
MAIAKPTCCRYCPGWFCGSRQSLEAHWDKNSVGKVRPADMWVGTLRRRLLQRQHHVGCGPRGLEPGTRTSWRWRPPGLCDQRYTWVHLFGAVQPVTGRRFALVMPVVSN